VDTFSTLTVGEILNAGVANYTYTGEITDGAGNLALTKIGAGTQVLGGVNSYTGPTNVSLGTLQVESGIPGSVVTVFSGGTFALGSTASQYPVAGFVLGAGGVFSSLVDSGTTTARQLQVGGDVFLDGGALSLTDLGAATLPLGTKLTLITYTGSLSGTFDALPEGGTVEVGSNTFAIAYQDAGAVTLTAVESASGYDQWALTHAPGQLPEQDYDLDGVANGIEWVVGGTKDTNDASKLPVVTLTPTQMVFTFRRVLASKTPDTTVSIEVGTTLASWPDSYDVETAPEVTVVSSDAESETLALTVPRGTDTAKFARLVVVID
jgi:autotransporter-associated beta strand protein